MQKLLCKDIPFVWDQTLHAEFDGIKQILRSPLGLKPFNKNVWTVLYTDYSSKGVRFLFNKRKSWQHQWKIAYLLRIAVIVRETEKTFGNIWGELGNNNQPQTLPVLVPRLPPLCDKDWSQEPRVNIQQALGQHLRQNFEHSGKHILLQFYGQVRSWKR